MNSFAKSLRMGWLFAVIFVSAHIRAAAADSAQRPAPSKFVRVISKIEKANGFDDALTSGTVEKANALVSAVNTFSASHSGETLEQLAVSGGVGGFHASKYETRYAINESAPSKKIEFIDYGDVMTVTAGDGMRLAVKEKQVVMIHRPFGGDKAVQIILKDGKAEKSEVLQASAKKPLSEASVAALFIPEIPSSISDELLNGANPRPDQGSLDAVSDALAFVASLARLAQMYLPNATIVKQGTVSYGTIDLSELQELKFLAGADGRVKTLDLIDTRSFDIERFHAQFDPFVFQVIEGGKSTFLIQANSKNQISHVKTYK